MPIISAKVIKNPRMKRYCDRCDSVLIRSNPCLRLYGNAKIGDPLMVLYICLECASKAADPKIIKAIEDYQSSTEGQMKS